jgi:hypothetical protein
LVRWRAILASVLVLILALLIFPFKLPIAPLWSLRVLDESGMGVRDIKVTEHWQHYLVEPDGHEEVRQTDPTGRVEFPERNVRVSIASRALARLRRFGSSGMPARSDPYASIVVWGNRYYETTVAVHEPEGPLQAEVVVHRQR